MCALLTSERGSSQNLKIIAEVENLGDDVQRRWPSLPDPLMLEWSESPLLAIDRSSTPWIIEPVERDPLRGSVAALAFNAGA